MPPIGPLVPLALLLLFGGRARGRSQPRRVYGPDPLREMATPPPITDDFRVPASDYSEPPRSPVASYPDAPYREYQQPLPQQTAPAPQAPTSSEQWNPEQQPPPFAPAEGGFYPPLQPLDWGNVPPPPAPEQSGAWEPLEASPQAPTRVPTDRPSAARMLAQHILSHHGNTRDRALIRQLQRVLGVGVDGLIGPQTLGAIQQYGSLSASERAALTTE